MHARARAHTHTHTQKKKMSAIHDTKEIKMKIQEPYSECNTKYTAKPCSESVPTFSFVRCPCLTMVVYGHFNNTDLSKLGSDTGSNILNTKVKALYKMYKNHIYRTWYLPQGQHMAESHSEMTSTSHRKFLLRSIQSRPACNGLPCPTVCSLVLCPCKSKHTPHRISTTVFSLTQHFRLSHAYSVLPSQASGQNIYTY